MNNEKVLEYLTDIGVVLFDNIDLFFQLNSSKNNKNFKNEPERLKDSLFLYLQKTCKNDNFLRLMSKHLIESYYNSQAIIKYKTLKNFTIILQNKFSSIYHNFIINISRYISNRSGQNNDKSNRRNSDENFYNNSYNKNSKNRKAKSKKKTHSLKRTNRYKNNYYKNIRENNINPHSFYINNNDNYLNINKNDFEKSGPYMQKITNISYDNNNFDDNIVSYKYYSPMVNIPLKKPLNNYYPVNMNDNPDQQYQNYQNDINMNNNDFVPMPNQFSKEDYMNENINFEDFEDYDFFENEKKHLQKVQNKLMNLKNEKITKIEEQCTFSPQINSNNKFIKNQNGLNVFDKLYKDFNTNKTKKEDKIKKYLEEFKFTPQIEGNDKYKITTTFEDRIKKYLEPKKNLNKNEDKKKPKKNISVKKEVIDRLYQKEIEKLREKKAKEEKLKKLEEKKKHVIDWKKAYKDYYKKYPEGEDYKKQLEKRRQLFESIKLKKLEEENKKNDFVGNMEEKENNNELINNNDVENKIINGEENNINNIGNNIEEDQKENDSKEPEVFKSASIKNLLNNNNLFKDVK